MFWCSLRVKTSGSNRVKEGKMLYLHINNIYLVPRVLKTEPGESREHCWDLAPNPPKTTNTKKKLNKIKKELKTSTCQ